MRAKFTYADPNRPGTLLKAKLAASGTLGKIESRAAQVAAISATVMAKLHHAKMLRLAKAGAPQPKPDRVVTSDDYAAPFAAAPAKLWPANAAALLGPGGHLATAERILDSIRNAPVIAGLTYRAPLDGAKLAEVFRAATAKYQQRAATWADGSSIK